MNVVNSLGRDRRGEGGLVRGVAWTALSALPVVTLETILLLSREESLVLRFFCFHASFVSRLTSASSHRSLERLPPKHSFLSTCCAWFPYPISTYLSWTSFSYTRLPQRCLFPSVAPPKPSFYIHLSSCTMNTAWSVHYLPTYLRRPHRMYSP